MQSNHRIRELRWALALLIALGCASSLASSPESRPVTAVKPKKLGTIFSVWPFFHREVVPEEGSREALAEDGYKTNTHILYPLIHIVKHNSRTVFMFKPLFNVEYSHGGLFRQWQVLWPFFLWRQEKTPGRKEFWFMPIISWRSEPASDRKNKKNFLFAVLMPLVITENAEDGSSGVVLGPIYGKGCRLFAYEQFDLVLWPLYTRRQRLGDRRYDFIWPIFSVTKGKRQGFRIWPLYVEKRYPGRYVKKWALWPIVHWGTSNLHARHPVRQWGIFPLYRQSVSDVSYERRYLSIIARVRGSKVTGESESEYIWPISMLSKKPRKTKDAWGLWPFFIHTDRPKVTRTAALYVPRRLGVATMPLIWKEDNCEAQDHRRKSFSFFPLWFDTANYYTDSSVTGYQRLFPFYGYEQVLGGDTRVGVLSLPHFHDTLAQGFERNYSILGLYQYRRWADGFRTIRFLGALYRYDRGRGLVDLSIPPFYRYREDAPGTYFRAYVFGLIKVGRKAGRRTVHLVYIPVVR